MLTWWIIAFEAAATEPTFIGSMYRGDTITPTENVIGLIWALADGFAGDAIFFRGFTTGLLRQKASDWKPGPTRLARRVVKPRMPVEPAR